MQYGNLPEVEMSHYSLINPLQTVPFAGSSSEPCYATCKGMALCVCVSLFFFLSPCCPWLSTVIAIFLHSHKYRESYRKLYC